MGTVPNNQADSEKSKLTFLLLFVYMVLVLSYTVFLRSPGIYELQLDMFWSYQKWLAGNWRLGWEILGNIGMFVPIGFLLAAAAFQRKRSFWFILFAGVFFSAVIEFLQFELMRGLFELDDIFNNTLGAVLGFLLYQVAQKLIPKEHVTTTVLTLGVVFVICGFAVCTGDNADNGVEQANTPRAVCFQIDNAALEGEKLLLTGFAFYYERTMEDVQVVLKSTKTGKEAQAVVQYGLHRPDVDSYFHCDRDYSKTGFTATVPHVRAEEEYEVFLKTGRFVTFSTGVFVTGNRVHYVKQGSFVPPDVSGTDLEEIVTKGHLRVYRPDRSCYVYQYKRHLYWIVDEGFDFEEDGTTYIQYHLWTTQVDKLPQKRLKNNWFWDNIGGYFEKHEITNRINCGRYRVCKRKLPEEYAITSIATGYYKKGEWVCRNYFRPVYEW